jgi:hypothetical protein
MHPPQVPVFVVCVKDRQPAVRFFGPENVPYHQEDRRHMRKGRSHATGMPFAQSRGEERQIERERGIYFTTKAEMTAQEKTLVEHHRYVKEGGTALKPEVLNPPPDPRVAPGTIMKKVREKGIRLKP